MRNILFLHEMEENVHLEHIEYHFRVYWGYIDWIISKLYLNKLIVLLSYICYRNKNHLSKADIVEFCVELQNCVLLL